MQTFINVKSKFDRVMRRKNNPTKESKYEKNNSAVQPMTVKGEYASVGDLKMYYEIQDRKSVV